MKKPGFRFWLSFTGAVCAALLLGDNIAGDRDWWGILWLVLITAHLAAAVDAVWPEHEKE